MQTKQIPLELYIPELHHPNFVVSLSNIDAYNAVQNSDGWHNSCFIIIGEEGSGKTTLGQMWLEKINGVLISDLDSFDYIDEDKPILLENIDAITDENKLFYIINHCMQSRIPLLMTAGSLPIFKLRDLGSRIHAIHKEIIKNPDDELFTILINKYFAQRQLKIPQDVMDFILSRVERSYGAIKSFVRSVDNASLSAKRKITIPLIKEVLEAIKAGD